MAMLALCGSPMVAEEEVVVEEVVVIEEDQAALAKQIQNPLANLVISLPLQFNFNDGVGELDRRLFNLNVQPVIPFSREKWNIISRTIIPVNSVPVGETLLVGTEVPGLAAKRIKRVRECLLAGAQGDDPEWHPEASWQFVDHWRARARGCRSGS
jgi:hypothetical protein